MALIGREFPHHAQANEIQEAGAALAEARSDR
jgi:hypothetical protein